MVSMSETGLIEEDIKARERHLVSPRGESDYTVRIAAHSYTSRNYFVMLTLPT